MKPQEKRLETNLERNDFFIFSGADGWRGGVRTHGLTAINWREIAGGKYEVVFFHGEAARPMQITLSAENFERLVVHIS